MKKIFYRVCNPETEQGLWYNFNGEFTGLIHNEFNFCTHNKLEMPFDEELVGYLSATDSLDDLYNWFSKKDILKLQKHGWFIHIYESEDFKYYEKFNHLVISQKNSRLIDKLVLPEPKIIEILGVEYVEKHKEKVSTKTSSLAILTEFMLSLDPLAPRVKRYNPPKVNLLEEIELIKKKESSLSRSKREWVLREFEKNYELY